MKFWKLLPILVFAGVLMAATVGVATVQNINSDHNYAAEGEQDARDCNGFEVEYGQDDGHVDRVKLHYDAQVGNVNDGDCQDQWVNVEVHNAAHDILGSCGPLQIPQNTTSFDCDLATDIFNQPDCTLGTDCVADIDHVNIVVTDLH